MPPCLLTENIYNEVLCRHGSQIGKDHSELALTGFTQVLQLPLTLIPLLPQPFHYVMYVCVVCGLREATH